MASSKYACKSLQQLLSNRSSLLSNRSSLLFILSLGECTTFSVSASITFHLPASNTSARHDALYTHTAFNKEQFAPTVYVQESGLGSMA